MKQNGLELLKEYLNNKDIRDEATMVVINEWINNLEENENVNSEYMQVLKFFETLGWGKEELDILRKNDIYEFFTYIEEIESDLKEQLKNLNNKLIDIFEEKEEEKFLEEAQSLIALKDNQIMEVKTILEIFILSGDYDKLKSKLESEGKKLTTEELINELNNKLKLDTNNDENKFIYDPDNKDVNKRITFKKATKGQFDITYTSDTGEMFIVDVTSDTTGGMDYSEGKPLELQPIVSHYKMFEDKELNKTGSYYFVPNIYNRLNKKLLEFYKTKKPTTDDEKFYLSKGKIVYSFLTALSKLHHISVYPMDLTKFNELNEDIKTLIYSEEFELQKDLKVSMKLLLEIMKHSFNYKEEQSETKIEPNYKIIYEELDKFLEVSNIKKEDYRELILKEIHYTINLNQFYNAVYYKVLFNAFHNGIVNTEDAEKLFNYFFKNNPLIHTQVLKDKIEAKKQKEKLTEIAYLSKIFNIDLDPLDLMLLSNKEIDEKLDNLLEKFANSLDTIEKLDSFLESNKNDKRLLMMKQTCQRLNKIERQLKNSSKKIEEPS